MTDEIPKGIFPVKLSLDENKGKWRKSPAINKGENWQTYQSTTSQLSNSKNIGVMIPKGVIVFDLDISEERTLENLQDDIEEQLNSELEIDWDSALIQNTVSGGSHYAFKIEDDIEVLQQTNALGVKGFDLRVSEKGWICTGNNYNSDNCTFADNIIAALYSGDLVSLPITAVNLLPTKKIVIEDDEDNDLMDIVSSQVLDLSNDEVESYVSRLPFMYAEDQDLWFRVGMAINHQTKGSDFGWEVFNEFSKQSPDNYNEEANFRRWQSFSNRPSSGVTFASIIKYVRDHEVDQVNEEAESKFEELVTAFKMVNDYSELKEYGQKVAAANLDTIDMGRIASLIQNRAIELTGAKITLPNVKKLLKKIHINKKTDGDFIEHYVFRTDTAEYFNTNNKTSIGPRAFDIKHSRETPTDNDGERQTATMFTSNTITCVDLPMYAPMFNLTFNHEGLDCVNTYSKTNLDAVEGDGVVAGRLIKHIAHLLPDAKEQAIVINYLAHNVQHPGTKLQWGIVLQGVQGDGKTLLAELMQLVMGLRNIRILNAKTLEGNFTDWSVGQCMTFIEEIKLDGKQKYEVLNSIKPYITNEVIEVHPKGSKPHVALNTSNYFALTNYQDAIPIDSKDRRYCVLFSQWQSSEKLAKFEEDNKGYYPSLYKAIRDSPEELLYWLLNHEIPQSFYDTKRAPHTKAKELMKHLAKPDGFLAVEDAIVKFERDTINNEWVNSTELYKLSTDGFEDDAKNFPAKAALKHILEDMGYHNIGRYKNKDRMNQQIYAKDDTKTAIDFKDYLNRDIPF